MTQLFGASVLPFSVDPFYHGIYFLLGKERKSKQKGSEKWADFGGKRNDCETSIKCAAREFWEETCCSVRIDDKNPGTIVEILRKVAKRTFWYFFRSDAS